MGANRRPVGVRRTKPLKAMRDCRGVRARFHMEEVTYQGEFVQLDRIRLDVAFGDSGPRDIPLDIGATGEQTLELSGEICDGAVLNYVVSVDYIRCVQDLGRHRGGWVGKTLDDGLARAPGSFAQRRRSAGCDV